MTDEEYDGQEVWISLAARFWKNLGGMRCRLRWMTCFSPLDFFSYCLRCFREGEREREREGDDWLKDLAASILSFDTTCRTKKAAQHKTKQYRNERKRNTKPTRQNKSWISSSSMMSNPLNKTGLKKNKKTLFEIKRKKEKKFSSTATVIAWPLGSGAPSFSSLPHHLAPARVCSCSTFAYHNRSIGWIHWSAHNPATRHYHTTLSMEGGLFKGFPPLVAQNGYLYLQKIISILISIFWRFSLVLVGILEHQIALLDTPLSEIHGLPPRHLLTHFGEEFVLGGKAVLRTGEGREQGKTFVHLFYSLNEAYAKKLGVLQRENIKYIKTGGSSYGNKITKR